MEEYICTFCNKIYNNKRSYAQHIIRCKLNPNKNKEIWNKGLTKETDARVRKYGESISKRTLGKKRDPLSEEHKKSISRGMVRFLDEHPDKVPYLLNHSSKMSYPEKYFIYLFDRENIPLDYHKSLGRYQLDFSNQDLKIDVEIDGEQHYVDKKIIEHDKIRNDYLINLGWIIYRIRWSSYKQLSFEDKQKIIYEIKKLFL